VSLFEAGQKAGFCIETVEKVSMAITSSVKVFRLDQLQTQNVITAISNMIINTMDPEKQPTRTRATPLLPVSARASRHVGKTRKASPFLRLSSGAVGLGSRLSFFNPTIGSMGSSSLPRWDRKRPPQLPARPASSGEIRWRCCRFADTTWPITGPTG